MSTHKYIIELTPEEQLDLMAALVERKRDNLDELSRAIANGDTGPFLELLISRDSVLQHLFTLVLYAQKDGGEKTNAE